MKKHLKTLLPIVLVIALALALSIAVFASGSTNEAKIGDTEYATLEEAVTAANASGNATIVLLKDINRTVTKMGFTKNTTIDLNGHTVSATNPASTADPLMAVSAPNVTLTLSGKGTFNVAQKFLQISSNNDGAKIIVNGTDSGIVINQSAPQAALMINSGAGAEFTNAHVYATAPEFIINAA